MASKQRKPAIQPRATKASTLRLQKQQNSDTGLVTATKKEDEPAMVEPARSSAKPRVAKGTTGPTAGVKEFMAKQRARMAHSGTQKPDVATTRDEPIRKTSNFMTGAQRYGDGTVEDRPTAVETRKIQVVIKQAKATGKLDISSRGLSKIPEEVLKMYHVDPNSIVVDFAASGDAWYDSVELTKFIAGDNAITEIDSRLADEFGALKILDFRDNKLRGLPDSLSQLKNLTSVMMPYNSFEEIPKVLYQLSQLKELNLSHNKIRDHIGLQKNTIEQLDLSHNEIRSVDIQDGASNIVKLDLSNNQIMQLPTVSVWSKLKELLVGHNKLETLFPDINKEISFPSLIRLEAGNNLITMFGPNISMPNLVELSLTSNKLQDDGLVGLAGTPLVQTLDISSNQLQNIPITVTNLTGLQRLDVRGNQLYTLPYELGKLESLRAIYCTGNPMRSFASMGQTQLIESLKSNYHQQKEERESQEKHKKIQSSLKDEGDTHTTFDEGNLCNNFTQTVSLTKRLDLSKKQLSELTLESVTFSDGIPGTVLLDHNKLTAFPANLTLVSNFIVKLYLEHNLLTSFSLTMKDVVFTSLKVLNLSNNRLRALECIQGMAPSFPVLEELTLDYNSLCDLPETLSAALPYLKSLSASSNKLDNITANLFGQNLEVLILSNNDIGYLPPGLSELENLKELVVFGNRFRVPRPAVVEQGTRAILDFLKHRYNNSN